MSEPRWIVVMGASAGGVEALRQLFGSLRADLDAAFLVVLHVPPHSPSRLDKVLSAVTAMPVSAAEDGERLERGHVYVASAAQHLMVEAGAIRQTRGPKECRVRPAIDVLFRSAAIAYGPRAVGVLLSGLLAKRAPSFASGATPAMRPRWTRCWPRSANRSTRACGTPSGSWRNGSFCYGKWAT